VTAPVPPELIPKGILGISISTGIMVADRYGAYKTVAEATPIILAFCWAQVRRDFIDLAASRPHQQDQGLKWLQDISHLHQLNDLRLQVLDQPPDTLSR